MYTANLIVPPGCSPGDTLQITVANNPQTGSTPQNLSSLRSDRDLLSSASVNNRLKMAKKRADWYMITWIVLELIVIVLLGLCIGNKVLPFASLHVNEQCHTVNPLTNANQTVFYMSLFQGFGSAKPPSSCINSNENFCVPWDNELWDKFDKYSHPGGARLSAHTPTALLAAQILFVVTLCFVVATALMHVLVLCRWAVGSTAYSLYLACGYTILIAFALSLSSIANISSSPPFLPQYWIKYFASTDNLLKMQNGRQSNSSCDVEVRFQGGALLATAVAVLLILTVWTIFSACLSGSYIFESTGYIGSSRHSRRAANTDTVEDGDEVGRGIAEEDGEGAYSPIGATATANTGINPPSTSTSTYTYTSSLPSRTVPVVHKGHAITML